MNISDHIKDALSESVDIGPGSVKQIHDNDLLPILKEKGVLGVKGVSDLMSQLQFDNYDPDADTIPGAPQPKPATHFIDQVDRLKTISEKSQCGCGSNLPLFISSSIGWKAFLEHLQEADPLPGQQKAFFTLHLNFRGQRFQSCPVPCACDPDIQKGFLLELHKESSGEASRMADNAVMLSICDPVHIALVKTA